MNYKYLEKMTNFFKLDNFLFDSNIIGISSFSKYLINFKISLKEFIENNKPEIFISPEFIDENNNFNVYDITNATIDQKIKCLINHRRGGTIKILKKILEKSDNEDIIKILSDQRIYERLIISYDEFCINDDEQWKNYSGIKDKLGVIFMESLNIDYKNNLFVHPSSKSILIEEKKEKNEEEKIAFFFLHNSVPNNIFSIFPRPLFLSFFVMKVAATSLSTC